MSEQLSTVTAQLSARRFAVASALFLLTASLTACAGTQQQASSGTYSQSRCFVAPNPSACRLQGSLDGNYTNPTVNAR